VDHNDSLTQSEIDVLARAKVANPHWFSAVVYASGIMSERRQKYAGQHHPYFNFVDMARRMGYHIREIFRFYLNLKLARLTASNSDFDDESITDTYIDVANYALIAAGWNVDRLTEAQVDEWDKYAQSKS